jgi:hypothetical protein
MKKITLLTVLLIGVMLQAQNINKMQSLNSGDLSTALKLAAEMNGIAKTGYHLIAYKEYEQEHGLLVVYGPDGITKEELNRTRDFSKCLVLQFRVEGSQSKSYKLDKMTATYNDVFAVWKEWFRPTAEADATLKDYRSREFRDDDRKVQFYIQQTGTNWTLRNDS